MRKAQPCPQCAHLEFLFVPHIADRDDRDGVRRLSLHVKRRDWKDDEIGQIQAYVCRGCGYTGLWHRSRGNACRRQDTGAKLLRAKA